MARIARIVVPGLPHLVTQRGTGDEQVFFGDEDYQAYLSFLSAALRKSGSEVWAWCLVPSHVHLIVVPGHEDGLRQTVANPHRRYAARINARNNWAGPLWRGRFSSVVMDTAHLYNALAYVSLSPVRAGLVRRAQDWKWSSVHAHLAGRDDAITTTAPALSRVGDFAAFLGGIWDAGDFDPLRKAEIIGRPIGSPQFIESLEKLLNRRLRPRPPGRKKKLRV